MSDENKKIEDITKNYNVKDKNRFNIALFIILVVAAIILASILIYAFTFK